MGTALAAVSVIRAIYVANWRLFFAWEQHAEQLPSKRAATEAIDTLTLVLTFIFSWVILTPIAIIVAGKMFAQRMKFVSRSEQLFKINLFGILNVEF